MDSPVQVAPRYRIEGVRGEYYDVFNKRKNAIKAAINLAAEYPGVTFVVIKRVNFTSKVIFQLKLEIDYQFEDIQDVYRSVIETFQEKLDKTEYWRKSNDS